MNNDSHNQHLLRPPALLASINATSNQNHMSSPQPTASLECGHCGFRDRWILHHVRLRGLTRRLCTSCVLRLHPFSFCPSCFQFYDPSSSPHPLPSNRLMCCKCSSITHSDCVSTSADAPPHSTSSSTSYVCPPCTKPGFSFFDLDAKPTSSSDPNDSSKIGRKAALVMVCAARIAYASMSKAVIVARADAERKVRDAAYARKRAREALEHVTLVVAREKGRRKEGSYEVSGSATMNTAALGSGGMQRKGISNGVKKDPLVSVEEGPRHNETEAKECVKSNGTPASEEATASLNGEADQVQNNHRNVGENESSKQSYRC